MPLTPQQLATLKADIAANVNTIPANMPNAGAFVGVAIKDIPDNDDGNLAVATWYNQKASPEFYVYRNNITSQELFDKIEFAKLTPADTPDGTQTWANRSLACQGKQFNLQLILDRSIIDATKSQTRATLQDALTNIPSGVSGNTVSAWVPVRDSLYTTSTNAEKLFSTGTGTTGSPATRAVYGNISGQDIDQARDVA